MTDFPPEGGCMEKCALRMNCGHTCPKICHTSDRDHLLIECQEKCTRLCPVGHPCPKKCFKDCHPCMESVTKTLPCTHEQDVWCFKDPAQVFCKTVVWKVIYPAIYTFLNYANPELVNRFCRLAGMEWTCVVERPQQKPCALNFAG